MADTPKDTDTQAPETGEPHSEIDLDLVKLPRPRASVRPILALAIIAICLTLMIRLYQDLRFSRDNETPVVTSLAELTGDLNNRYIDIHAIPDRPQALRLVPTRSTTGQILAPVLGSGGKLWLLLPTTPWSGAGRIDEHYQGRLTRMADMEFYDELTTYLKSGHSVPRPIPLGDITKALQSGNSQVHDASGDVLTANPKTVVRVLEVATNTVEVLAVTTDPYADEAGWSLALQNVGILPVGQGAVTSTTGSWTFHVPAPNGVQGVAESLGKAKLWAAKASEITETRSGTWSELVLDGQQVRLGNHKPGFEIRSVALSITPPIPGEAYLLNTTEHPKTYWYVMTLVILLGLFSLLFAFGIYRASRP